MKIHLNELLVHTELAFCIYKRERSIDGEKEILYLIWWPALIQPFDLFLASLSEYKRGLIPRE